MLVGLDKVFISIHESNSEDRTGVYLAVQSTFHSYEVSDTRLLRHLGGPRYMLNSLGREMAIRHRQTIAASRPQPQPIPSIVLVERCGGLQFPPVPVRLKFARQESDLCVSDPPWLAANG